MPFLPWGPGGNLAGSVTHLPYWSTFGPCGPGHWYQKSSWLMYRKPRASRPLFFIARAAASSTAAFDVFLKKLQLLHPITGFRSVPAGGFVSAWAAGALATIEAATGTIAVAPAISMAVRPCVNLRVLLTSPPPSL